MSQFYVTVLRHRFARLTDVVTYILARTGGPVFVEKVMLIVHHVPHSLSLFVEELITVSEARILVVLCAAPQQT